MVEYKVNTDKEFFDKFEKTGHHVKLLGGLFQNNESIVSDQEAKEWITAINESIGYLNKLRYDGLERLEEINKKPPIEIIVGKDSSSAINYLKEMMNYFIVNNEAVFRKTNGSVVTNKREIRAVSVKVFPRGIRSSCVYIDRSIPIGDCEHISESMTKDCKVYYFN